jgi:hypothetical protein
MIMSLKGINEFEGYLVWIERKNEKDDYRITVSFPFPSMANLRAQYTPTQMKRSMFNNSRDFQIIRRGE